jgi:hypothetical protein
MAECARCGNPYEAIMATSRFCEDCKTERKREQARARYRRNSQRVKRQQRDRRRRMNRRAGGFCDACGCRLLAPDTYCGFCKIELGLATEEQLDGVPA